MVAAAAISFEAQTAIERHLARSRDSLGRSVRAYLQWLGRADARHVSAAEFQRRFTLLRLQFNAMLSQVDIFADVLTQRSEHEIGTWLSGLDVIAADAAIAWRLLPSAAGHLLSRSRARRGHPTRTDAVARWR